MAQGGRISTRAAARAIFSTFLATGLLAGLTAGGALVVAAASPKPITIATSPASGPPGLPIAISGGGYAPGIPYGLCILPAGKDKCGYEGANLIGGASAEHFTAAADGTVPDGTTAGIPDLVAGAYQVVSFASDTGAIVARADFTVTAPTFGLGASAGAGGSVIPVTLTGAAPNVKYTICAAPKDTPGCGGTAIVLVDVTTDASGAFPAGTTILVPGLPAGTYVVGVFLSNSNNTFIASAPFEETAPTMSLDATSGPAGTIVAVTGSGYAPGQKYVVCLAQGDATQCGAGINLVAFQADATGGIPAGTTAMIPSTKAGPGRIGVVVDSNTPWFITSTAFEVAAGTAPPPSATAPVETVAVTPGQATAVPASTPAPTGSEGSGGIGPPIILIVIVLLVVLAVGFWLSRRRREDDWPPAR